MENSKVQSTAVTTYNMAEAATLFCPSDVKRDSSKQKGL